MIRLSEMYLIMAEALTMSFDYAGAGSCMNQIRSHRGLSSPSWQIAEDQGAMLGAILDEYFRETLGEGRYFFALRHLYRLSFTVSHVVSAHSLPVGLDVLKLKYPYPLEELSYGRVQDE